MSGLELLYAGTIAVGLPISAYVSELPVNIFCLGLLLYFFATADKVTRVEILAVLGFSIPMELFFSEVWLIYEYQRGLMPLYVPAGHWFVFDLGRRIAERFGLTNRRGAFYLLAPFVPATAAMAWAGVDTSGVVLLSLMLAFTAYAVMGWLALGMELWGTHTGVWAWAADVPHTGLKAWNPPILVGAFYGFGDLLVNLAVDAAVGRGRKGDKKS